MTHADDLAPECARLVGELRGLRGRAGLSLAALAAKTAYSKSSWDRYLSGRALPPREAVAALCMVAGEPPARHLALWELADRAWSGRGALVTGAAADSAGVSPGASPSAFSGAPSTGAARPRTRVVAVLAGAALVGLAVVLAVTLWPRSQPAAAPLSLHRCQGESCTGKNPVNQNCGGQPDTLAAGRAPSGTRLEMRYSSECRAAWARIWHDTRVGDKVGVSPPGGRARTTKVGERTERGGYVDTPMVAVRKGQRVHACYLPADGRARTCVDGEV